MAEHTPGSWSPDYTEISGIRYRLNGIVTDSDDMMPCIEGSGGARLFTPYVCRFEGTTSDEANARLIAAAPDLLAALKRLLEASSISESDCSYDQGEQDEAHEQARAALAKATGETR